MVEPEWQLRHDGFGIWGGIHRDAIALEGFDEGLGHTVRLRAAHRRGARFHADVAEQGRGVPSNEAGAVVGKPFDGLGQHVDAAKAVLDSRDHEVLHVLALDALGGGDMGDCVTVAAVEGEGDPDLLLVVAADLEAVGAPSDVRAFDGDLTVMATLLGRSGVAHQQQIVHLHDSVNALGIGPRTPGFPGVAAQNGMDTPIAVGGHVGDDSSDVFHQFPIREWWASSGSGRGACGTYSDIRPGDTQRLADGLHPKIPLGRESERNICFFEPVAISRASLRISPSIVFLPNRRCNSFTWF